MKIVHTELKALLKEIDKFQAAEEIDDYLFEKVEGELEPGSKVEIHWADREFPDEGYAFTLPNQDADEWDICIHVPDMDICDGIGDGGEVYMHLYSIVQLERVKKIVVK